MRTIQFVEIDPYCRAVLKKHWPDVPCHDDIRTFAGVPCDVICGGFPCQDISVAGKGAGLRGSRSGLWTEYARLVRELRPSFVIVENVSALLSRGLGEVLGDLASIGYDAEWHCIPASHLGAPHRRDRIWVVAYPSGNQLREQPGRRSRARGADTAESGDDGPKGPMADANGIWQQQPQGDEQEQRRWPRDSSQKMADTAGSRLQGTEHEPPTPCGAWAGQFDDSGQAGRGQWEVEPDVGRVVDGLPSRVDRIRCLSNAVVPQIVEKIGRAIMKHVSDKSSEQR